MAKPKPSLNHLTQMTQLYLQLNIKQRDILNAMVDTGLYGNSRAAVAMRIIDEKLQAYKRENPTNHRS